MLGADAVVDAVQPPFEVREDEMDDRQELLGHLRVAAFGNRVVIVTPLPQAGIAAPIIGDDQRSRHDGTLEKSGQRCGAAVVSDGQPDATGIATILALVLRRARLPATNLDGGRHQRLVVDASPVTTRAASNLGFVQLNMLADLASNPVLIGSHHARTEFMQNAKGGLVSCQPKLPLKLHGRHALRPAGNKISSTEPRAQGRVAALHDHAYGQPCLTATAATCQHPGPRDDAERFADDSSVRAGISIAPPGLFQIGGTGCVIGKEPLEVWERLG